MKGIYCFEAVNEKTGDKHIIYVGKTARDFKERFDEHQRCIDSKDCHIPKYEKMRQFLKNGNRIVMRSLICLEALSLSYHKKIADYDLEMMEMAFISYFKPALNQQGVVRNYSFTADEFDRKGQELKADAELNDAIFTCDYYTEGDYKPIKNISFEADFVYHENDKGDDNWYEL